MKKLTKIATLILAGTMALSLAACGSSSTSSPEETVNPVDKINIVNKDGEIVSGPALETETPAEETEEETASWRTLIPSTENVNLDDASFTMNGVTYTVGETTLQDMIDAGAPLDEESLAAAGTQYEETKGYSETPYGYFGVLLDSEIYGGESFVRFAGNENSAAPEECILSYVDFYPFTESVTGPSSEGIVHYSFTVDGTTYEPSVMSMQDVFDKLGDYARNPYLDEVNELIAPDDAGYHFFVDKTIESGAGQVLCEVQFNPWNDTDADLATLDCLAFLTEITLSVNN